MLTNVTVSVADPHFSTKQPQTPVAKRAPRPTQLGPRPFSDDKARLVKQPPTPSWTIPADYASNPEVYAHFAGNVQLRNLRER